MERLVTTEQMAAKVKARDGMENNWSVRMPDAVDGPDVVLPVDPYAMGAWLGDGCTNSGIIISGEH